MSDNLITVGTYGNAVEAEIVHAALTEEDIPAFVESELAATALPGTSVKVQVPTDRVKKATRVIEHVERHRMRRLPPTPNLPGDRLARHALLLACFALILFPVLLLLRAPAVLLFGEKLTDLLKIEATAPMFALPALISLASVALLIVLLCRRLERSSESDRYVSDAWKYNLIVLGAVLVSLGLVWVVGRF